MQNFTDIPSTRTLSDSLAEILNNDKTALSLSSGTAFPTTNLQLGMPCYRSDEQKLYILTQISPSAVWKLWMDFTGSEGKAPNAEAVDGVDSSTIVPNTRQINAGTGLSGGGDLSANRTLSLAAGAAAANLGFTPLNKAGDTATGNLLTQAEVIGVNKTDANLARLLLKNTNREWTVSNYGSQFGPNGSFNIADETAGAVRLQIDTGGRVITPSLPAFSASKTSGGTNVGGEQVFNSVYENNGGHYNSANGRFTAPVTGRYFFSAALMTGYQFDYANKFLLWKFLKNGGTELMSQWFQAYNYSNANDKMVSGSILATLNAGDYVSVSVSSTYPNYYTAGYNHFSGFLIG